MKAPELAEMYFRAFSRIGLDYASESFPQNAATWLEIQDGGRKYEFVKMRRHGRSNWLVWIIDG